MSEPSALCTNFSVDPVVALAATASSFSACSSSSSHESIDLSRLHTPVPDFIHAVSHCVSNSIFSSLPLVLPLSLSRSWCARTQGASALCEPKLQLGFSIKNKQKNSRSSIFLIKKTRKKLTDGSRTPPDSFSCVVEEIFIVETTGL
ncbi:hypothetical protein CRM22_010531 [Opisthorchis felineus]|uniref:Uncharacterized protein n=1 Tax=Opisthorchis felineus TaxID=147828 RepID=A0A4S2KXX8_OPIFE|nr:hypothetical protein CRM22_010531 [Opisthorchis felineus]